MEKVNLNGISIQADEFYKRIHDAEEKLESGELYFSDEEFFRRYEKLKGIMKREGFDALIVTGTESFFKAEASGLCYLSGHGIELQNPYIFFPLDGEPVYIPEEFLFTGLDHKLFGPMKIDPAKPFEGTNVADFTSKLVEYIEKNNLQQGNIGLVSMRFFPADVYQSLKDRFPEATFTDGDALLYECRVVKSDEEIEFMKKAAYIADKAAEAVIKHAKPGITEKELLIHADVAMAKAGGGLNNFNLLKSVSWNELNGFIYRGSDNKVKQGDIILTEFTGVYKGYFTQLCVMISVGDEQEQSFVDYYNLNKAVYDGLVSEFKVGRTSGELDKLCGELTSRYSDGISHSSFACQTILWEYTFHHPSEALVPGVGYIVHPWIMPSSWVSGNEICGDVGKGFMGHTIGNTCVCTEGEALVLNHSATEVVIV